MVALSPRLRYERVLRVLGWLGMRSCDSLVAARDVQSLLTGTTLALVACLEILHRFRQVHVYELDTVGDRVETWVWLPDRAVVLGRHRGETTGPQIRADDATLSRCHAEIVPVNGGFIVRDRDSSGGTFINNIRVCAGGSEHRLEQDDMIYLGAPSTAATACFHATEPTYELDGVERDLAAAVRARVAGSGAVYADWLEQRGDLARARLLRAHDDLDALAPNSRAFDDQLRVCSMASTLVDPGWRIQLLAKRSWS